jgi:general secretion pathway protein G
MIYLQEQRLEKTERGDGVVAVELPDRRFILSRFVPVNLSGGRGRNGFTLIELVITVTVLSILTLGIVPLLKLSVTRQKEQQLRDSLRQMRTAIDEFHRDTVGMNCTGTGTAVTPGAPPPPTAIDPRSKVVISDCTIFGVDNPDRYPPDLQSLVDGVNVLPRGAGATGAGVQGVNATDVGNPQLATKKKVYLRGIPINPFTGGNEMGRDWELRSCYDAADSDSWGGENAFDVVFPHSKDQNFKPLKEGDKYSDW